VITLGHAETPAKPSAALGMFHVQAGHFVDAINEMPPTFD
jgi:hypothetical protein